MKQNTNADEAQTQVNTLADVSVGDVIQQTGRDETETVVEVTDNTIRTELDGGFERTHALDKINEEMNADKGASFKLTGNTDTRHFLMVVEAAEQDSTDETATVEGVEKTETGTVRFTVSSPESEYEQMYLAEQHDDISGAYKMVVSPATIGDDLHKQMTQTAKPLGVETIDTA